MEHDDGTACCETLLPDELKRWEDATLAVIQTPTPRQFDLWMLNVTFKDAAKRAQYADGAPPDERRVDVNCIRPRLNE